MRSRSLQTALRQLGRTRASAFKERSRDVQFALAWDEATDCELDVLQMRLVARALDHSGPGSDGTTMSADLRAADRLALQILKTCRAPSEQAGGPVSAPPAVAPRKADPKPSPAARASKTPADDPQAVQAEIDSLLGQVFERIRLAESRAASASSSSED